MGAQGCQQQHENCSKEAHPSTASGWVWDKKFSYGNFPSLLSSGKVMISEFDNTDIFTMKSTSQPVFSAKIGKNCQDNYFFEKANY